MKIPKQHKENTREKDKYTDAFMESRHSF